MVFLLNLLPGQAAFADGLGGRFKSWLLGAQSSAVALGPNEPGLDATAKACLKCHDGTRAIKIEVKDAAAPLEFSSSGKQVNHPVGMDYDVMATERAHNLKPRILLDTNIVLADGKVTCTSCHRLKETRSIATAPRARRDETALLMADTGTCSASSELTVGPKETDLCLACHAM